MDAAGILGEKMNKGDFGYLASMKKKNLLISLLVTGLMAIVIGIGLWLNKGDIKNIYTVVGILFALPLARFLSVFLVVMPMKPMDEGEKEEIITAISQAGSDQFLWDMALSSQEKVRHFPCIIWSDHHVVAWYEGKDNTYQNYLSNVMKNNCHRVAVEAYNKKEDFLKAAKKVNFGVTSEEEWERIKETILVYQM